MRRRNRAYAWPCCYSLGALLERALPDFGVFIASAGIKEHDSFFRLEPARGGELSRCNHGCCTLGCGEDSFQRGEFPSGLQHLFVGDGECRSFRLAKHVQNQNIPERSGNAQARSNGGSILKESGGILVGFPCPHDGRTSLGLHDHHAGPVRSNPAHLLHLVESLAHADQSDTASRGIENNVGKFSSELLPELVSHGFLALDAVRLLERGYVVPAFAVLVLGDVFATIGDQAVRSEERRVGKECRSRWSPYH